MTVGQDCRKVKVVSQRLQKYLLIFVKINECKQSYNFSIAPFYTGPKSDISVLNYSCWAFRLAPMKGATMWSR